MTRDAKPLYGFTLIISTASRGWGGVDGVKGPLGWLTTILSNLDYVICTTSIDIH